MTETSRTPVSQSVVDDEKHGRWSTLTDPTSVAALLVVVSAAIFLVIAVTNRHDHSTHVHPGTEVSSVEASAAETSAVGSSTDGASAAETSTVDAGASGDGTVTAGTVHDHSTHVHSDDLGPAVASTDRINPSAACRTIIGCDDAGPSPQHPGDRGGWAQLVTLGVVALGVAFIALRIVRSARSAPVSQ